MTLTKQNQKDIDHFIEDMSAQVLALLQLYEQSKMDNQLHFTPDDLEQSLKQILQVNIKNNSYIIKCICRKWFRKCACFKKS